MTLRSNEKTLLDRIKEIERKWQERWEKAHVFEADPDESKPKFFVTFPYPYVNAYPHLGGAFTILRVDVTARYKRMRGYNVLFPQGWHATGGPIVASALRLREGDKKIIETLKSMGVKDDEIEKFKNPEYWVSYFSKGWREDLKKFGMSIDWRREFHTTSLNPYYSKFIEWQYLKLKEKGLVGKGEHPVVWCPKENKVVGDHDRPDEYAGISPVEAVIIKFKTSDDLILPALTFRPETIYGVTNVWVDPDHEYLIAEVDGEKWVINDYMAKELAEQKHTVKVEGRIQGKELLGRAARNPVTGDEVPVLPAKFVDPELGTGIVMSVPAHAPYDYVALMELKENPEILKMYGLSEDIVKELEPIPLIKVEGYSKIPARDAVARRGIKQQTEKWKLDDATKEIYAKEYHTGVLLEITGRWAGRKVSEVKDEIIEWMVDKGFAITVHTLPERVYCRCGARTHVKLVSDQWFLLYSKPEWKRLAHRAVDKMRFLPTSLREVFHKNIDWLRDWACTHKRELGTPLPWDKDWVIESLSDSTIYMAYYTLAKYLQHPEKYGIRPEQLIPEVFDYVLLGKGDVNEVAKRSGIPANLLEEMRREFLYWYPVDLRISGKDLIPNHLTFFIFHHVAIFPEEHWPRGIGTNGWILVSGEKMSKHKGNFILLRQAIDWWGADATRWAEILAGADAGLDDANFEPEVAESAIEELLGWIRFAESNYGRGRTSRLAIDDWFESVLNRTIGEVTEAMEATNYKTALVKAYYNMQNYYKWYIKRAGEPNRDVLKKYIEAVTLMIAPFAPHTAEEVWERIGKEPFISTARWPEPEEEKINPEIERAEELVRNVLEDIREIRKFVTDARKAKIIIAAKWKYDFVSRILEKRSSGLDLRRAIQEAIKDLASEHRKSAGRLVKPIMQNPEILSVFVKREVEVRALSEATEFLARESGIDKVEVVLEEEVQALKKTPLPAKPAIILE
ncbi:MAG: leucine--tRNA ligase [Desulfurococcales archaeon]|nr:leucine--tRNA ligase [Desulfurococcales archaeon]